jgi:hypothetical protein
MMSACPTFNDIHIEVQAPVLSAFPLQGKLSISCSSMVLASIANKCLDPFFH